MSARILRWREGDNEKLLKQAADILSHGGLVAIPTETVYGLAADATNGEAVARIFAAKGRPRFNPLIAHVADLAMARSCARFDARAERLAQAFWPGPLTLVLPLAEGAPVHPLVTAGLGTIAIRRPSGPSAELIARFGRPLAAPSANPSGRLSPTSAAHVAEGLGESIDAIIDAGPCRVGLESTIVSLAGQAPRLLRPGGLNAAQIEAVLGERLLAPETVSGEARKIEAPGMMSSHYAPRAALRLDAARVEPGEALLAFGPALPENAGEAVATRNLSPAGSLVEAAASLFAFLHELDRSGAAVIAVAPVPRQGLGAAINDRLARAAAPRA
ncbi:L-threonylcarbamoyladenylate synthase [Afifella sp. IM 167]|uniref:L-threonylcarbamoyladenylate synthase n=1 Tax=Afifella sp. IM 167 TaxID=2033586 RepID=UPI001CCE7360|nr:L-threonylcarbamoyladenylate synthase [Afifella sp. IM 167]MBZ8133424.1 threonylcarbamoyl-AMP synthase [Afifella sp. IM 167]